MNTIYYFLGMLITGVFGLTSYYISDNILCLWLLLLGLFLYVQIITER